MARPRRRTWRWGRAVGVALLAIGTTPLAAQAASSAHTLEALPDYTPFERQTPPRFFPDALDQLVADALVHATLGDLAALEADHAALAAQERGRGGPEAGSPLADQVLDLLLANIVERDRGLEAQEAALALSPDPTRRAALRQRLQRDLRRRADASLLEGRLQRMGGFANRLLGSANLLAFLSPMPLEAPIQSLLSAAMHLDDLVGMDPRERRALVLYEEFLRRYPDSKDAPAVAERVEGLRARRAAALRDREIAAAEAAQEAGRPAEAEFHFRQALVSDPDSKAARRGLAAAEAARQGAEAAARHAMAAGAGEPAFPDPGEAADYESLLRALAAGEGGATFDAASAFAARHPASPLADAAKDAAALALERQGRGPEARALLEEIAASGRGPEPARAEALLRDPEINRLLALRGAKSQHTRETIQYVLLGRGGGREQFAFALTPLLLHGTAAIPPLAPFLLVMRGMALFEVVTGNPISQKPIIEAAQRVLREGPSDEAAVREAARALGRAYEREGAYEMALYYYALAGEADEARTGDLRGKAAKALRGLAERARGIREKGTYLAALARRYPETEEAKEALRGLRELMHPRYGGIRITRKFLQENPDLAGPEGLGLKASLVEGGGDVALADEGVTLLPGGSLLVNYRTPQGPRHKVYPLDEAGALRALAALREVSYRRAAEAEGSGRPSTLPAPGLLAARLPREESPGSVGGGSARSDIELVRGTGPAGGHPAFDLEFLTAGEQREREKGKAGHPADGPRIQADLFAGSPSAQGVLPALGTEVALGASGRGAFGGTRLPLPVFRDSLPLEFLVEGGAGRFGLVPQLGLPDAGEGLEPYK